MEGTAGDQVGQRHAEAERDGRDGDEAHLPRAQHVAQGVADPERAAEQRGQTARLARPGVTALAARPHRLARRQPAQTRQRPGRGQRQADDHAGRALEQHRPLQGQQRRRETHRVRVGEAELVEHQEADAGADHEATDHEQQHRREVGTEQPPAAVAERLEHADALPLRRHPAHQQQQCGDRRRQREDDHHGGHEQAEGAQIHVHEEVAELAFQRHQLLHREPALGALAYDLRQRGVVSAVEIEDDAVDQVDAELLAKQRQRYEEHAAHAQPVAGVAHGQVQLVTEADVVVAGEVAVNDHGMGVAGVHGLALEHHQPVDALRLAGVDADDRGRQARRVAARGGRPVEVTGAHQARGARAHAVEVVEGRDVGAVLGHEAQFEVGDVAGLVVGAAAGVEAVNRRVDADEDPEAGARHEHQRTEAVSHGP